MRSSAVRMPGARAAHPLVCALRCLWTLPTNLVGHAVGLLVSGAHGVRRVRGPAAAAVLYPLRLPGTWRIGAVTLGHVILVHPPLLEGLRGRLLLAHELSHTRQHDVLGPLFLPAHVLAQLASAAGVLFARAGGDPIHALNPLEQHWLCLGFDAHLELARGERLSAEERERLLAAFGV